ncbi:hypothetical protein [Propionicimonas sp.]|uniref:hypothetical protein n=1 Tax=Propionicimonas sp. TaxID=1955623 RepID=UPI0039E580C1
MRPVAKRSWITDPWALAGAAAGLVGLLVLVPGLPTATRLPALLCFVAVGPGAVLQSHLGLPRPLCWLVVPLFGLSVVILVTTAMASLPAWQPQPGLVGMATVVLAWSLWRVRTAVALGG